MLHYPVYGAFVVYLMLFAPEAASVRITCMWHLLEEGPGGCMYSLIWFVYLMIKRGSDRTTPHI